MSVVPEPDVTAALDAYFRIVTAVAADLTPHVAALEVTGRDGRGGAGSAVVFTPDGLLLTNAHVVPGRSAAGRCSATGEADVDVVGADPLSDLAVVRARTATPPRPPSATPGRCRLVTGRGRRQPAGADRLGDRRGGQRARPSLPTRDGAHGAGGRGRDPDRRRAQPRQPGGALADSSRVVGINTAVAGWGLGLAVPINDTTRRIIGSLPTAACGAPISGWSARPRRCRRNSPSAPAAPGLRIVDIVPGSPADRSGLKAGDLVLEADAAGRDAQSLQRLLFADAIGQPLPMTVHRRGAMVDVITVPTEPTEADQGRRRSGFPGGPASRRLRSISP